MMCKICGLEYSSPSMGGPGVCPSCDCGNFGFPVIERQRKRIEQLDAEVNECQSHRCADKDRNNDQIRRIAQLEAAATRLIVAMRRDSWPRKDHGYVKDLAVLPCSSLQNEGSK